MNMNNIEYLQCTLDEALKAGADAGDAVINQSRSTVVTCRNGKLEQSTRSETFALSLRVFVNGSNATVVSSDWNRESLGELAERAVAIAKHAPKDPYADLVPDSDLMRGKTDDLQLFDKTEVSTEELLDITLEMEAAALKVKGVTKSTGANAASSDHSFALCTTHGFSAEVKGTSFSRYCGALAERDGAKETDFDFLSKVYYSDLTPPELIGRNAGETVVKRLGGKKIKTGPMPVVFAPKVSNSLLGHFSQAISGPSVAMGMSFLKDKLETKVFSSDIQIIDDPLRLRGLGSRPFDQEGVKTEKVSLIKDGLLTSWLVDNASALQLGYSRTGHGRHGGGVSPFNLYMSAGKMTLDELIADIDRGFYVTNLFGQGVNPVTGDYSRGAVGFLIEGGEITTPVKEVTVAGNLLDMYLNLTAADDLEFKFGTDAPTVRIDGMTVAGS